MLVPTFEFALIYIATYEGQRPFTVPNHHFLLPTVESSI
jgi:hypothetical protein